MPYINSRGARSNPMIKRELIAISATGWYYASVPESAKRLILVKFGNSTGTYTIASEVWLERSGIMVPLYIGDTVMDARCKNIPVQQGDRLAAYISAYTGAGNMYMDFMYE